MKKEKNIFKYGFIKNYVLECSALQLCFGLLRHNVNSVVDTERPVIAVRWRSPLVPDSKSSAARSCNRTQSLRMQLLSKHFQAVGKSIML